MTDAANLALNNLQRVAQRLRELGEEEHEELVMLVMDQLTGWCGPQASLTKKVPADRSDPRKLLPSECPNCGRLHSGHDFNANPGPTQCELLAALDRAKMEKELEQDRVAALAAWADEEIRLRDRAEAAEAQRDALRDALAPLLANSFTMSPRTESERESFAAVMEVVRRARKLGLYDEMTQAEWKAAAVSSGGSAGDEDA